MLRTTMKLAVRTLRRRKGFSLINLFGLSLGMATALSIALYVSFELSYDDYHPEAKNIYRVILDRTAEGNTQEVTNLPGPVAGELEPIQGVQHVFRLVNIGYRNNSLIRETGDGRKTMEVDEVYYADPSLPMVLSQPLVAGSFDEFSTPHTLLLSKKLASRLFGDTDVVGESVVLSNNVVNRQEYKVIGVFSDLPENTDFDHQVLLSMNSLPYADYEDVLTSYNYWQCLTYVKLTESASAAAIAELLTRSLDSDNGDIHWTARLVSLRDLHFEPFGISDPGNRQYVNALAFIGLLVLIIAWVNYVNLATSRAMERSKEVGVRKVLGSARSQLAIQFIMESLVLNMMALLLAFTVTQALRPWLSTMANPMTLSPSQSSFFWTGLALIIITGAIISGAYPAFVMTSLKPASILSGRFRLELSGRLLRKGLVVLQFCISICLLIGSLTVFQQIRFMRNKDLGMNIDRRLVLNSPPGTLNDNQQFFESLDAFRKEILQLSVVNNITGASSIPGEAISWGSSGIKRPGSNSKTIEMVSLIATDRNFFEVYDLKMVAGRAYRPGDDSFGNGDIVINETAARQFGFESAADAVGENLEGGEMFPTLTIIGVSEDYHHTSLHDRFAPILYVLSSWANYYTLSLNLPAKGSPAAGDQLRSAVDQVEGVWKKYFPETPFDYVFADQAFDRQYRQDEQFGFMFGLFTLLAILLAILGLVGLVSYEVVQRTKEIGIRKVLGANKSDLLQMLTRKYILLVCLSGLIAVPFGYWLFGEWLTAFAFRIQISAGILLMAFSVVLVIAILVSALQVISAAQKNPVHSIQYE